MSVFISYRFTPSFETANHLYDLLARDKYHPFFDKSERDGLTSGHFPSQLITAISGCDDFIIVLEQDTFKRVFEDEYEPNDDWVMQELVHAILFKKKIHPVIKPGFVFPNLKSIPDYSYPLADGGRILFRDIFRVLRDCHGIEYSASYFAQFYLALKRRLTPVKEMPDPIHGVDGVDMTLKNELDRAGIKYSIDGDGDFHSCWTMEHGGNSYDVNIVMLSHTSPNRLISGSFPYRIRFDRETLERVLSCFGNMSNWRIQGDPQEGYLINCIFLVPANLNGDQLRYLCCNVIELFQQVLTAIDEHEDDSDSGWWDSLTSLGAGLVAGLGLGAAVESALSDEG